MNADAIRLGVTIAVGVISIGLAGFSVWLSLRFNTRSLDALDSIKQLATEIRRLAESSLDHQRDFSSRMLDSILDQSPYGNSSDQETQVQKVTAQLEKLEDRISERVGDVVKGAVDRGETDPQMVHDAIDSISSEVQTLREEVATTAAQTEDRSEDLTIKMLRMLAYPAFYPMIAAIVESGASSVDDLEELQEDYGVPSPIRTGVRGLIAREILTGDADNFSVREEYQPRLERWVERNRAQLAEMAELPIDPDLETINERRRLATNMTIEGIL